MDDVTRITAWNLSTCGPTLRDLALSVFGNAARIAASGSLYITATRREVKIFLSAAGFPHRAFSEI